MAADVSLSLVGLVPAPTSVLAVVVVAVSRLPPPPSLSLSLSLTEIRVLHSGVLNPGVDHGLAKWLFLLFSLSFLVSCVLRDFWQ